jgi:hypothetical protein
VPAPAPNAQKVQTFFHRAFDASSSEGEQQTAINELRKMFVEFDVMDIEIIERKPTEVGSDASDLLTQNLHGLTQDLDDLRVDIDGLGAGIGGLGVGIDGLGEDINGLGVGIDGLAKVMERLRAEKQAQAERIEALEAKISDLEAAQTQAEPAAAMDSDTGEEYVSWAEFEAAAVQAFGRDSWKSVAAFELDMDVKTLHAWQTVGVIPARYVAMVKALNDDQKAPASRRKWTDDEYERLETLVAEGHRDREIAKILSLEFRRRLVETSITGARRRLFRGR